jgi:hypothetical protein
MKGIAKNLLAGVLVTLGVLTAGMDQAEAASITGTLTADNHYGLFTGNEDGSLLNFIGRNEKGPSGSSGGYNWSKAETWNFTINPNDYLYVVAWDDNAVDESWIGQFDVNNDGTLDLLSVAEDWEFVISKSATPGDWGDVPSNTQLNTEISTANWAGAIRRGDNGMKPWGFIAGVSADADFLQTAARSKGKYTIFRTQAPVIAAEVPEPVSGVALLAIGAIGSLKVLKGRKS